MESSKYYSSYKNNNPIDISTNPKYRSYENVSDWIDYSGNFKFNDSELEYLKSKMADDPMSLSVMCRLDEETIGKEKLEKYDILVLDKSNVNYTDKIIGWRIIGEGSMENECAYFDPKSTPIIFETNSNTWFDSFRIMIKPVEKNNNYYILVDNSCPDVFVSDSEDIVLMIKDLVKFKECDNYNIVNSDENLTTITGEYVNPIKYSSSNSAAWMGSLGTGKNKGLI